MALISGLAVEFVRLQRCRQVASRTDERRRGTDTGAASAQASHRRAVTVFFDNVKCALIPVINVGVSCKQAFYDGDTAISRSQDERAFVLGVNVGASRKKTVHRLQISPIASFTKIRRRRQSRSRSRSGRRCERSSRRSAQANQVRRGYGCSTLRARHGPVATGLHPAPHARLVVEVAAGWVVAVPLRLVAQGTVTYAA